MRLAGGLCSCLVLAVLTVGCGDDTAGGVFDQAPSTAAAATTLETSPGTTLEGDQLAGCAPDWTVDPLNSQFAGGSVAITATGFTPGSPITVRLDGSPPFGNAVADAAGEFAGSFDLPAVPAGDYTLIAEDAFACLIGRAYVVNEFDETPDSTVTPTSVSPPLPVLRFEPDGLGFAHFGDSPATVIDGMTALFGPPIRDSGWVDEPLCPGPLNRFVDFGVEVFDLRVIFTNGDLFAAPGTEHFYTYVYLGNTPVPVAPPHLTVGTTVGQLMSLHPTVYFDNNPFADGVIDYHVDGPGWEGLYGQVSGTDPNTGVVTSVQGGIGCGE